ncbi:hypothetical protein V6U77_12525 [Micromonospora sp. CPCC 205546]|uniref:hypothetical protein n=1 Tax=Micromonospora sp. CPCC 205546 TaxID=3122397 RepID=UPI002FF0D46B
MTPTIRATLRTLGPGVALTLALSGCAGSRNGDVVSAEQTPVTPSAGAAGSDPPAGSADATPDATGAAPSVPGPTSPSGRTGPPLSATRPPTLGPPTAPPRWPSDLRKANVLAGRITRGGAGPCYGLVTDDGREYALHGTDKGTFATGAWVRVTIAPADPAAPCGPGTPASIVKIDPVG